MNKTLKTALLYLSKKVSVIPLNPKSKLPACAWKDYAVRLPTEAEVTKWWTDNPEYNLGVVTGLVSNLTVVDFDVKNGLSSKINDLPQTLKVKTPSGGFHLYYKYEPSLRTGVDIFGDMSGVDIRNDGGYVVAPPSVIEAGPYKVAFASEIKQLGDGLKLLNPSTQHVQKSLKSLVDVKTGGRNNSMASLIGKLLKVTPMEKWDLEVYPIACSVNKTYTPPLGKSELDAVYQSISTRERSSLESKDDGQSNDMREFLTEIMDSEKSVIENIQDLKVKNSFLAGIAQYRGNDEIIDTKEILRLIEVEGEQEKFLTGWDELDKVVGGFTPGELIVLSAPTKNGKTSWSMSLTQRMSQYSPAWFPFEEGAKELVRKFLERNQEPPLFYTPRTIVDNQIPWIEKKIVESLVKNNSRIFFIDQLHFIIPETSENLSHRIGVIMRDLKRIARTWNVVIVLMTHLTKTDPSIPPTMQDIRDSSHITQTCDTLILLWREAKREKKHLTISNNLNVSVQLNRRMGKTGNIRFTFDNGHFREFDWEDTVESPQNKGKTDF